MDRAILGDVIFDVITNENVNESSETTDYAVEDGQDVTDHVKQNPTIFTITGVFVKEDSPQKLATLRSHRRKKDLLTYVGRNIMSNLIITGINRNHNASNKYGLAYDITLKQIRVSKAKSVEIVVANPATNTPSKKASTAVKPTTNKGKQQPKTKPVPTVSSTSPRLLQAPTAKPGETMKIIRDLYTKPENPLGYYQGGIF